FVIAHLVELDDGIVAAPGPYARRGLGVGQQAGAVAHHVPFYQRRVAADGYNTITRHPFQQVMADDDAATGMPIVAAPVAIDEDTVSVGPLHGVMFDGKPFIPRRGFAAAVLNDNARTAAFFLHQAAVYIMNIQLVEPYRLRYAEVLNFNNYSCSTCLSISSIVRNIETGQLPCRYVIEVYGGKMATVRLQARFIPLTVIGNYDGLLNRARPLGLELTLINAAGTEQQGVAGLERFLVHTVEATPGGGGIAPRRAVVAVTG